MNATNQSSNSTIVFNPHRGLRTVQDDRLSVYDNFFMDNSYYGQTHATNTSSAATAATVVSQLLMSSEGIIKNEQPSSSSLSSSSSELKLVSFEPTPIGPKETICVMAPSKVDYSSKLSLLQDRRTLLECLRPLLPVTTTTTQGSRSQIQHHNMEDDIFMLDSTFTSATGLQHHHHQQRGCGMWNLDQDTIPITDVACFSTTTLSSSRSCTAVSPSSSSCDNSEKSSSLSSSSSSLNTMDSLMGGALIPAEIQSHNNINTNTNTNNNNNNSILGLTDEAFAMVRFRASQMEQWGKRYQELIVFREEHGHCVVPLYYPANPTLSHWVKRQRCQYKLKVDGKHSTLTDERQSMLEELGFTWDSHNAAWDERFLELCRFKEEQGHCNVPSSFPENPPLAAWIKCQRRYIRTYFRKQLEKERATAAGRVHVDKTAMKYSLSGDRVKKLIDIGLRWKKKC